MTYEEALRWLYGLSPRGIRLELDRMRRALAMRADPHAGLAAVHIAGTNGKGSTSAMIEAGLRAAGTKTGLYTSPHLHSFTERIRIDGRPIDRDEVARRATALRGALEGAGAPELTFFEVATLIAFEAFRDARCEIVVLEVGMGGRLDATNVLERPRACAITSIAIDHQRYLGTTIAEIAREKAGIAKPGVPLVLGASIAGQAREVIERIAREVGAPVIAASGGGNTALAGAHQRSNAALASTVLRELGVSPEGIAKADWPGRLERIGGVLLDAAHNPEGAASLAAHLEALGPRPRVLVFGAMADKDWRQMLAILGPEIDRVIAVAPPMPRAERAEAIAEYAAGESAASIGSGIDRALALAGEHGLVIVAGSIFVLAEARAHLLGIPSEPPIPM